MSRTRQMIELQAPSVMREKRLERFAVTGFTCPECKGNGWVVRLWDSSMDADRWGKVDCPTCGGTGEVDAEVTVSWKRQQKKEGQHEGVH